MIGHRRPFTVIDAGRILARHRVVGRRGSRRLSIGEPTRPPTRSVGVPPVPHPSRSLQRLRRNAEPSRAGRGPPIDRRRPQVHDPRRCGNRGASPAWFRRREHDCESPELDVSVHGGARLPTHHPCRDRGGRGASSPSTLAIVMTVGRGRGLLMLGAGERVGTVSRGSAFKGQRAAGPRVRHYDAM